MSAKIKDVAAAAGVSVATVSRVLSNGPVSDALRLRVLDVVKKLGYRPNLSARRLRSQHSETVGLIVSDIRNPFFTAVSRAVEDVAYRAGMRVILCNADEDPEKEAMYLRLMQEERVSGVVFSPTITTAERFDFPIVMIDRSSGETDAVVLDNALAASQLVDHLVAQGRTRIAGLFGNISATGFERRMGYEAAMARHQLPVDSRLVPPSREAADQEIARWLALPERPDAIIASNGLLLLGTVQALSASGVVIPGDIALAGFDNEVWTALVAGGLTVIEQPIYDIGAMAMDMLLSRIENPNLPKRKLVLNGRLVVRGSTAAKA